VRGRTGRQRECLVGCDLHRLMAVHAHQGFHPCIGSGRHAEVLMARRAHRDELANGRREWLLELAAVLNAELDLLQRANADGGELLDPLGLGSVQCFSRRPRLTPCRKDPAQAAEQVVHHFRCLGCDLNLLVRFNRRQISHGRHDLVDWLHGLTTSPSAQALLSKSGSVVWRRTGNGRTLLARLPSPFTHLTSNETHLAWVFRLPSVS